MARRTIKDLTQKQLKELLHYDPDTGIFTWAISRRGFKKGKVAGNINSIGYRRIYINKKSYLAHRLAWLYMEGYFPEYCIDHINRIRNDNRFINLRHVSIQCNIINSKISKTNTSGITGICWRKLHNIWLVRINANNKRMYLGSYENFDDAVRARWNGEVKYNFANCNTTSSAYLYLKDKGLIDNGTVM